MKKVLGSVIAMVFSAALCFSSVLPAQAAENIEEAIIPEVAPVIEKSETDTVAKNAARGSVDGDSEITWTENTFPASIETTNYSLKKRAYLTSEQDGFMRVAYDGKSIVIEYYDEDFQMVKQGYLPMELDQWGGFYKGEDSYYIVEGHINKDCIDDTEVVRIIKYDFDWNRLGAGSVLAKEGWEYEIRKPFLYSCVNMCEVNGKLYVVTGREGYVDENYGMGHQGMMLIRMDEDTVTYYVKDYRKEGTWKELTIPGVEFVRRFLMHVPPKRFVRIRHYGLLCTRSKNKHLTLCRNLLGCKKYISILKNMETPQILETLYGIKISVCKCCGGHLGKPQQRMRLRI